MINGEDLTVYVLDGLLSNEIYNTLQITFNRDVVGVQHKGGDTIML